ncbi:hypothetical protein C5167_027328 [Papaver somniferum]|nr:hypothetical protein C5167_027328 [Papaver somniferum]
MEVNYIWLPLQQPKCTYLDVDKVEDFKQKCGKDLPFGIVDLNHNRPEEKFEEVCLHNRLSIMDAYDLLLDDKNMG